MSYRSPTYDLTFETDLAAAMFSGNETIHIRLRKPATSVTLVKPYLGSLSS